MNITKNKLITFKRIFSLLMFFLFLFIPTIKQAVAESHSRMFFSACPTDSRRGIFLDQAIDSRSRECGNDSGGAGIFYSATAITEYSNKKASDLDSIKVTLKTEEISLREAFQRLISETKLQIIYNDELIKHCKVKCSFKNMSLREVIQSLLKDSGLSFKVMKDGQIVILPKKSENKINLSGHVMDEFTGEKLPYANITIKNSEIGTSSNLNGYFLLSNLSEEPCTLKVNYIGYEDYEYPLFVDHKIDEINIFLKQKILEGQEVIVTGEKLQTVEVENEPSQYSMSPLRLSALPSAGEVDIFRSLQLLPGISGRMDLSSGLNVRGGTADQNLILYDGITIYHVDHSFGFVSAFNSDAVQNVQIFKGGFPAKFGNRISSVVELTGKTGSSNQFQIGGGLNLLNGSSLLQVPLPNRGSILISFRRSYNDFLKSSLYKTVYQTITGQQLTNRPVQQDMGFRGQNQMAEGPLQQRPFTPDFFYYDLNGKLSYSISKKDNFSFSFYRGQDKLNRSQNFKKPQSINQLETSNAQIEDITKWGNLGLSSKWARNWNETFHSSLLLAHSHFTSESNYTKNNFELSQNSVISPYFSSEFNEIQNLNFRLDNEWNINKSHTIEFGTQVSQTNVKLQLFSDDSTLTMDQTNLADQTSFYIQDRWNPFRQLSLNLGLRSVNYGPLAKNFWEPRTSFQLSLPQNFSLKGSWGKFHQFINQVSNENILTGNQTFWILSDENLKPTFAEHKVLGLSYENNEFLFDVETYYKNLKNVIEFSPFLQSNLQTESGELFYVGTGVAKGIEFLAQKKSGHLNGWISYTLGSVKYQIPQINRGNFFPANQDRTHEIKLAGNYYLGKWTLSATWIYASGTPFTLPDYQYTLQLRNGTRQTYVYVNEKNASRLPAYHRMDLSVTRSFVLGGLAWDFGASILNFYNRLNVVNRQYIFDSRPIIIRDITTLGFTPTINLKVNLN